MLAAGAGTAGSWATSHEVNQRIENDPYHVDKAPVQADHPNRRVITRWFVRWLCSSFHWPLLQQTEESGHRKGYVALGIIGIFIPFLWLIGAILPAKRGSQYESAERTRMQAQMQ